MAKALSVLVLGGTGIIGRGLTKELSRVGHDVSIVSRRANLACDADGNVRHIQLDVRDAIAAAAALRGRRFDTVIDLVSFGPTQLSEILDVFLGRCGQYIFISSATVYESAKQGCRIVEDSPKVSGGWTYPLNKAQCEEYLAARCTQGGQTYTIVRPYITYSEQRVSFGPWEAGDVMARLRRGAPIVIGDEVSRAVTSLTHSDDLGRGIAALVGNEKAANEAFHIASEEALTWRSVYEIAAGKMGVDLHIEQSPVANLLRVFPELKGKVADRQMDRRFDNNKLLNACPEFRFSHTVRSGYSEAITGLEARGVPQLGLMHDGRMDRIGVLASGSKRAAVDHARTLARGSVMSSVKYWAGYYRPAYEIARAARSALHGRDSNDYGIG